MTYRVAAIARATFLEAVRDRVLLVILFFTLGLVLFSRVLGWLSVEDELKLVQDISLTGILLLSLFLAMLVGAFSLAKEIERRTLYPLLSRDLTRGQFVLGKFLGLAGAFALCVAGSAAAVAGWSLAWGGHVDLSFAAATGGLLCEMVLLTSVALFLGALAAPTLAAIGTCVFALASHSTEALRDLTADGKDPTFARVYELIYKVMPNLEDVNFVNATTSGHPVAWHHLGLGALAILCWSGVFLGGAMLLFRRREF